MAEDLEEDLNQPDEADEGEGPPRRSRRLLLFIAVPILVVVIALVAAYLTGMLNGLLGGKSGGGEAQTAANAPAPAAGRESVPGAGPVFYDMPEILVNLNSQGQVRRQNFLKIRVSLELQSPLDVPKIEAVMPRIVDNFQVYLRELRVDDLQGSAGMLRLREELLSRVNVAIKPAKVNDVLFKEILVQ